MASVQFRRSNQAISAIATVLSVLLGGWLAFRSGVRQLRHERAIDRRLEWQEKLQAAVYEYSTSLRVLISEFEKPFTGDDRIRFRDHILRETTQRGRDVQALLGRVDLYGTLTEREDSSRIFKLQIAAYIASWTFATKPGGDEAALTELKRVANSLAEEQKRVAVRIRQELALPVLQDRAEKTDQANRT